MELKRICVKPYDKDKFEVIEDYKFDLGIYKDTIKKGFKTDGASIPRIFWIFYPPYRSEYFTACVIHDYLCDKANFSQNLDNAYKAADLTLKEAMIALNVNKFTTYVFYYSCRAYHKFKILLKGLKK